LTDADSDAQLWHQVIEILPAGPDLDRVLTLPPHPPPRPQLLANLATTAAVTAGSSLLDTGTAQQGDVALGDLLADRIRDAMLGLHTTPLPADRLHAGLAGALTAADAPALHGGTPAFTAERGLLIQSTAYTAAHSGDRHGMRELTDEEETHVRPAIRAMVSGLLVTGCTVPELRGFAARCGIGKTAP
jgi:hypothetical protein